MTVQVPDDLVAFDRSGDHLTAYVAGDIDAVVASDIGDAVLREVRPDDKRVWLDLSAVTFCNSSGIGMIMRLHQTIEANGALFAVYDPAPNVRRLLDIVGVSGEVKVRSS